MPAARLSIVCASYVNRYEYVQSGGGGGGGGVDAHAVRAKLSHFEFPGEGVFPVPYTARSILKKLSVTGGWGPVVPGPGPCVEWNTSSLIHRTTGLTILPSFSGVKHLSYL